LISEANFLLLDEPTNHLDFISENILIQALQQYKGSFVVISHNRHFVGQVANKIWYIENKQIKEYPGTYEEYEYWAKNIKKPESAGTVIPKVEKPKAPEKKTVQPSDANKLKNLEKELKKVESTIESLTQKQAELEIEMTKPEVYNDQLRMKNVQTIFDKTVRDLKEQNDQWEKLAEEIDALS
jgi:ATP-binding cassette subfamily F protein 3